MHVKYTNEVHILLFILAYLICKSLEHGSSSSSDDDDDAGNAMGKYFKNIQEAMMKGIGDIGDQPGGEDAMEQMTNLMNLGLTGGLNAKHHGKKKGTACNLFEGSALKVSKKNRKQALKPRTPVNSVQAFFC